MSCLYGVAMLIAQSDGNYNSQTLFAQLYNQKRSSVPKARQELKMLSPVVDTDKRFALLLLIGVLLMKYPKLGGIRSYDVTVPKLSGGVNTSESPHLINDNQLTDCLNMWWDKRCFAFRPGLWTGEDEIHDRYMRFKPKDYTTPGHEISVNNIEIFPCGNNIFLKYT